MSFSKRQCEVFSIFVQIRNSKRSDQNTSCSWEGVYRRNRMFLYCEKLVKKGQKFISIVNRSIFLKKNLSIAFFRV